jgi:AsmA protein
MKKFFKIAGILFGLALVLFIGLTLFVHFYFTDQRVKALLLPRLEEKLGRQVAIAHFDVGLLHGITAKDFTVKEKDGKSDFFHAKEFLLRYELLPLFQGRLIISKVILQEPFIRIERNRQGAFNFETLAFLKKTSTQEPAEGKKNVALPLALTIDQIAIEKARFKVEDQQGKLPAVDGSGNVSISVNTKNKTLVYSGRYDFTADVAYENLKPHLTGRGEFDPQLVSYQMDTAIDGQTVHLEGSATNWQKAPQVRLDLSSKQLDVDRLVALLGGGSKAATTSSRPAAGKKPTAKGSAAPLASSLPAGMTATGTINIDQALYRNLEMKNFTASYELKEGILRINDLSTNAASGGITGSSRIDLTRSEPSYAATMKMYALQAGQLATLISKKYGNWLTGNLNSSVDLAGRGTAWPQIRKELMLRSEYTVRDGQLREFPITAAVAQLLDIPELRAPSFKELTGKLRVEKGQALLDSNMAGQDFQAKITGTVGLDGQLNLPVALRLTGPLARKIQSKTSLAKYLTTAEGGVAIDFKLTGKVSRPRPVLNLAAAGERLKEEVQKKGVQELERFLQKKQQPKQQEGAPQQPLQELLKGLPGH